VVEIEHSSPLRFPLFRLYSSACRHLFPSNHDICAFSAPLLVPSLPCASAFLPSLLQLPWWRHFCAACFFMLLLLSAFRQLWNRPKDFCLVQLYIDSHSSISSPPVFVSRFSSISSLLCSSQHAPSLSPLSLRHFRSTWCFSFQFMSTDICCFCLQRCPA